MWPIGASPTELDLMISVGCADHRRPAGRGNDENPRGKTEALGRRPGEPPRVPSSHRSRSGSGSRAAEPAHLARSSARGAPRGLEHKAQYLDHLRDHKHLRSTNLLERLNEEIKRRTRVVRIFPNPDRCLRLVRALCAEIHEGWLEDHRYLNMDYLKEQKKELMPTAA